ncbi:MAG: beta-glucosidase [Cellulomonas sp.]
MMVGSTPDPRIDELVARLTLAQKVRLLTGADFWSLHAEPAVGLSTVVVSDGPSGVRGAVWDERDPSLNLPSATALAATWDPEIAYRYGAAAAHEARRKGVGVVLGPTINLHRSPLGGRHFEAYSEDPVLTADIAEAFVRGLQDHGVAACPKHYVANDFETDRFTASVEVSEQALHELYLVPFERAVVDAGAWSIMSAYNAVGGTTMSEHPLLTEPLKGTWGFDGVVISDWTAVRSLASAAAGQDVVMPGPDGPWGDALVAAVEDGRIPVEVVDDKVRRILLLAARLGALEGFDRVGRPSRSGDAATGGTDPADIALAREAETRGIVLVRNDGVLPLGTPASPTPATIAVVGQSALRPRTQGGGSATVVPVSTVSPLDGLRAAFPDATVTYATGALVHDGILPFALDDVRDPETGAPGVRTRFLAADGGVVLDEVRQATELVWLGNAPVAHAFEVVTDYTATTSGPIELGWAGVGTTTLEVDGELVLESELLVTPEDIAAALMAPASATVRVEVEAGRTYRLRWTHPLTGVPSMPDGSELAAVLGFTAGWRPVVEETDALIAEAVEVARTADVVVVVVGTNEKVESEGFDRTNLRLPGRQDDLVAAVAAVNPRTVVVVNSGSPVVMPWRDDVAALLLTWFGGQEYGHAIADVLTGAAEPGGRLPTTWPKTEEDVPVLDVTPHDGVLRYDEGIHIGYRAWLHAGTEPAYPFGFGLGYTTWSYDAVRIMDAGVHSGAVAASGSVRVSVDVTNTGERTGRQVVQVYLSRESLTVDRPLRWLAGSAVVTAAPGETRTAEVLVRARRFQHWDAQTHAWSAEPGRFTLIVARDATDSALDAAVIR